MREYITQNEFNEIEDLVNKAISAYSKADASYYLKQLEIKGSSLWGYTNTVFSSLVCSVKRASGQVAEKDRLLYFVNQDLYKLKDRIAK